MWSGLGSDRYSLPAIDVTTTSSPNATRTNNNNNNSSIGGGGASGSAGGVGGGGGGSSQQETLADIEHISTIAGSIVSIASISQTQVRYYTQDAGYDTEHTSLNSDFDEAEIKRELLRDKWKLLFDMFDPEGFGEIPVDDFIRVLKSPEFLSQVPMNKRELLYERTKRAKQPTGTGYVTFQDFVNVMSGKRSRSFKCAVHQRDQEVSSENDFRFVLKEPTLFSKLISIIALEILPEERDRKYYADRYTCYPPPYFMVCITIIEMAIFIYHLMTYSEDELIPTDSLFIYHPKKREEVWRFIFYMVLHASWFHLGFNLGIQMLFGLPLEMVHGSGRIACIYLSGVLAGSLGTSIFDPGVYLVGASGGVYALMAAHLANVMLNYHQMRYGRVRLIVIFLLASWDVGLAIYERYAIEEATGTSVSYVAHLTGALAGLTIGLLVLKNFEQKLHEQIIWWIALGIYTTCIIIAIIYNILYMGPENGFNIENIPSTQTLYNDFHV